MSSDHDEFANRHPRVDAEWVADCLKWRGVVLTGRYAHWCGEYDDLPVDETCVNEWPCACREQLDQELAAIKASESGSTPS